MSSQPGTCAPQLPLIYKVPSNLLNHPFQEWQTSPPPADLAEHFLEDQAHVRARGQKTIFAHEIHQKQPLRLLKVQDHPATFAAKRHRLQRESRSPVPIDSQSEPRSPLLFPAKSPFVWLQILPTTSPPSAEVGLPQPAPRTRPEPFLGQWWICLTQLEP